MLLTATQSFCILHIIKHAVHTFVFGKECKDEGLFVYSQGVFGYLTSLRLVL